MWCQSNESVSTNGWFISGWRKAEKISWRRCSHGLKVPPVEPMGLLSVWALPGHSDFWLSLFPGLQNITASADHLLPLWSISSLPFSRFLNPDICFSRFFLLWVIFVLVFTRRWLCKPAERTDLTCIIVWQSLPYVLWEYCNLNL